MENVEIFNFTLSASKITSIEEFTKRGLEYRNHELLEVNNISKKVFSRPRDTKEKKLALIHFEKTPWNKYSENAEIAFTKYIHNIGYKTVSAGHPSLLLNSLDVLNQQVFTDLGMKWFESILLVQNLRNIIDNCHKDCVFSIQRDTGGICLFGLHKRIFSEEDAYILEKI